MNRLFTRTIYQAVIAQKSTIAATENTVINSDQKKADKKPVSVMPVTKLFTPAKASPKGSEKGEAFIKNLVLKELINIMPMGAKKRTASTDKRVKSIAFVVGEVLSSIYASTSFFRVR